MIKYLFKNIYSIFDVLIGLQIALFLLNKNHYITFVGWSIIWAIIHFHFENEKGSK
jgi:hypothetical protein